MRSLNSQSKYFNFVNKKLNYSLYMNELIVYYNDGNYAYQVTTFNATPNTDLVENIGMARLVGFEHCTKIPDMFLYGWTFRLKSIDLSPLKNVETIGDGFLVGYSGVIDLDLMPKLKRYGNVIIKH